MSRDLASERIGEKLLGGWTLRADACPRDNTPLMSNRAGRFYCACEDLYWEPGSAPPAAATKAPAPSVAAGPSSSPAPQPAVDRRPGKSGSSASGDAGLGSGARQPATSNEQAEVVAELLLGGWALLAQYCPIEGCTAPLMRNRQGKKYCPAHDLWVFTEEERRADEALAVLQSPTRRASGGTAPTAPQQPRQEGALAALSPRAPEGTLTLSVAAEVAQAALARRIVVIAGELDKLRAGDVAALLPLVDALQKCAAAGEALGAASTRR